MIVLGDTFQDNNRFNTRVREKLIKANKCLYVTRTFKAEGYSHVEVNYLFNWLIITISLTTDDRNSRAKHYSKVS